MRTLWFVLAAAFSILALAANWLHLSRLTAVVAITAAGVFLIMGFWATLKSRVEEPVVLDAEQEETIRRMKSEGNTALAISQIQMWFRYTSPEEAARIVREL